jgi:hypothetical protein
VKACSVEGCGRKHKGRGLCSRHLQAIRLEERRGAGAPCVVCGAPCRPYSHCCSPRCGQRLGRQKATAKHQPICSVAGCGRQYLATGLCAPHYRRQPEVMAEALSRAKALYWEDPSAARAMARARRAADPEKAREARRRSNRKHRDQTKARKLRWYRTEKGRLNQRKRYERRRAADPEKMRSRNREYKKGLPEAYLRYLLKQQGWPKDVPVPAPTIGVKRMLLMILRKTNQGRTRG